MGGAGGQTGTAGMAGMADAAARAALQDDLERAACRVHQPDDPPLFTATPAGPMQSHHWRWAELEPLLERIGQVMAIGSGGQRRTLRLTNPGQARGTTHTFWASIQVILPGEIATAHRHSANALRFIMQGSGCTTTVDGEQYALSQGDLVLTPAGTWHDHHHHGSAPMIWLDILDIGLMQMLDASFFEAYPQAEQPVAAVPQRAALTWGSGIMAPPAVRAVPGRNPLLAYPAAAAQAALAAAAGLPGDPCDDVILAYRNPLGGPVMATLAVTLQRLRAGFSGVARRQTGSKLYWVVDGSGSTEIDGVMHHWSRGDFLTLRPWAWHRHVNPGATDAVLLQVSDAPVLQALGYWREERRQ